MAPSTVISSTSLRGHTSASDMVNVAASNTFNPLGASFGGPAVTASPEDTSAGPLLLDPTDSTATTDVPALATRTFSLIPLNSSTPSSEAVAPSSISVPADGPSISQATLIGVTVAISVIALIALCLLYYLWWRKRRPTKSEPRPTPKEKERRRVTWTLRGVITEREARDPFADMHEPLPPLPRRDTGSQTRASSKVIHCATDAGSVYVLDGECIYGDNGASVKGVLPPAYDDLPRKALQRGLPPLPPNDATENTSPQQYSNEQAERTMRD